MIRNTLFKTLIVSILISSLFITSCNKEEKNIIVQDDVQKASNELDEDARIFTKVKDMDIPEVENAYINTISNDSSPVFSKAHKDLFTLNSDNSHNTIENNLDGLYKTINKNLITYFKGTELWMYDANTKEKQLLVNLPDIEEELENSTSMYPFKISGDNNYLSIISLTQYDGYHENIIRILDSKTGKIHKSAPLKDSYLSQNVLYSKVTNKFYTSTPYSENILEFSIDDMNPKEIIRIPGINVENFKMSEDGKYIYFTQKDRDSRELSFCKFDLQSKNIVPLLKIFPKEKDEDLFWRNFDISGNTIVYTFFSNKAYEFDSSFYKSSLYAANISEESLTDVQLLYSTPANSSTSVSFSLSQDGTKLLQEILTYNSTRYNTYSLYEKTK